MKNELGLNRESSERDRIYERQKSESEHQAQYLPKIIIKALFNNQEITRANTKKQLCRNKKSTT